MPRRRNPYAERKHKYSRGYTQGYLEVFGPGAVYGEYTVYCYVCNEYNEVTSVQLSRGIINCGCQKPPRVTYIIKLLDGSDFVKLGSTRNMATRLPVYNTHTPYDIEVLREIDQDVEAQIKRYFKAYHHKGEWFHFTDEMLTVTVEQLLHPD